MGVDFFDEIVAQLRAEQAGEVERIDLLTGRIVAAAQAHGAAKKEQLRHQFAQRFGVKVSTPASLEDTALALAAAVESVPECAPFFAPSRPPVTVLTSATTVHPAVDRAGSEPAPPVVHTLTEAARVLNPPAPARPGAASAYPALAAAVSPLLLIGGVASPEKLSYVRADVPRAEWLELTKRQSSAAGILSRVHSRKHGAVVLLEGFIRDDHAAQLRNACKAAALPYVTARDAGQGQLRDALGQLERVVREAGR